MAKRIRRDYNFLKKYCEENNITLLEDYSNLFVKNDTIIKFSCNYENCNKPFEKKLRDFFTMGPYCRSCIVQLGHIKRGKTNMGIYGCECSLSNNHVQEKIKKTNLEIYGKEYASQNEMIKNKMKKTNLEKYGFEYAFQNEKVRDKFKKNLLEKYGFEYVLQIPESKDKFKKTCLQKFGVENPSQSKEIKEKVQLTSLQNWGTEYPSQSKVIKDKMKETNLQKYGFKYASQSEIIKNRVKQTCLEKFGCEYVLQNEEIKNRIKETCLEKYGCEYAMQNQEVMEKNAKSCFYRKEYVFPSGRIDRIQGYENIALDELLENEKIEENDIITGVKNVPEIWYYDNNGKKHRHYVDIFIPSQNRCIEVKSTWTAESNKDCIFLKQEAAKKLGYKYEIWVYDKKREKVKFYS